MTEHRREREALAHTWLEHIVHKDHFQMLSNVLGRGQQSHRSVQ